MSGGMSIKDFAAKYEAENGSPLKMIHIDKDYGVPEGANTFGKYMDPNDPPNDFVGGSNLLSVTRAADRFGYAINSLDGITQVVVDYNGARTTLDKVPNVLFYCGFNEIEEIPDEFSKMSNIFCVFLARNKIKSITNNFPPITRIYLDYNYIKNLPTAMYYPGLKKLSVESNPLGVMLPLIGNCTQIVDLEFDNTGMTVIPDEISNCRKLRVFSVTSNNISSIPASFVQKVSVGKEVRLDDNPKLTTIPYQPGYAWGTMKATISIEKTGINVASLDPALQKRINNTFKEKPGIKYRDVGIGGHSYVKWIIVILITLIVIILLGIILYLLLRNGKEPAKREPLLRGVQHPQRSMAYP